MKKRTIIASILGIFLLISCGPKRYGCGPSRRCEVKQNSKKSPFQEQSFKKRIANT
jgi:hypothetical protein